MLRLVAKKHLKKLLQIAPRTELSQKRKIFTSALSQHENPLGLPLKGKSSPPSIPRRGSGQIEKRVIPNVKKTIAVASGKGGVGKSTTAVNLALAFSSMKKRVGILDADIFGPSIPTLMNLKGQPELTKNGRMVPLTNYGVECLSMGFLVEQESAIAWRGMMVMKALQQLIYDVDWTDLDLLVIDMPPGTGDVQLTIGQLVPLSGAVIVSTPQDVALVDVRKGVNFFQKVKVPILGVVQNMSMYHCPQCRHESHPFGKGGASRLAKELGVRLLGDIPLTSELCELSDTGSPIVVSKPSSTEASIYNSIAQQILIDLETTTQS